MEKQLNVWIDSNLKAALLELARSQKKTLKELVEAMLKQEVTIQRGETMEKQALPAIRKIVQLEARKANEDQLAELCEYLQSHIINEIEALSRRSAS